MTPTRILLADDHEAFLREFAISLAKNHEIVGAASSGSELVQLAATCRPGIILTDISMPDMSGFLAVETIMRQPAPPPIIFVTMSSSHNYVKRALQIGVRGFVLKLHVIEQIEDAIQFVVAGGIFLSPQLNYVLPSRG